MLTRKIHFPSAQTPSLVRTFTSTALYRRSPGLGDISPDGASGFNARQKEFRDGLEIARKKREQAESQLQAAIPRDESRSNSPSTGSPESGLGGKQGIGSLSIFGNAGEAREAETESSTSKRTGKLSSLIYGTDEGRKMDQEIERSFSQVLARGKYVHSIVFHDVKPKKVDEYAKLVGEFYPKMANIPENKVNLVGSWRTEVGDCDTFGE